MLTGKVGFSHAASIGTTSMQIPIALRRRRAVGQQDILISTPQYEGVDFLHRTTHARTTAQISRRLGWHPPTGHSGRIRTTRVSHLHPIFLVWRSAAPSTIWKTIANAGQARARRDIAASR